MDSWMIRRFIDIILVAFRAGQEAENLFKLPFDNLNHRFIELKQAAFWAGHEA